MILFLTEEEILDIDTIINLINSAPVGLYKLYNREVTECEHYKQLFLKCKEQGTTDPQAIMDFVLSYENRYKSPEDIEREAEEQIRREKLQSLNKKQDALNALYEEGRKIYEELTECYKEQPLDQEKIAKLNDSSEEIRKKQDDLDKIVTEERDALFPPQEAAEYFAESTEPHEEPVAELSGESNGPVLAEDFS
jgi:hypothetical protein